MNERLREGANASVIEAPKAELQAVAAVLVDGGWINDSM
jgi:hypothetical protein